MNPAGEEELRLAALEAVRHASQAERLIDLDEVVAALEAAGEGEQAGEEENLRRPRGSALWKPIWGVSGERKDEPDGEEPVAETEREFRSRVAAALAAGPGIESFESLSGRTVYHAPDLLSATYARILDCKNSPVELMAGEIRLNSRDYPRPVPVELFEAPPFDLSPELIENSLKIMAASPDYQDITFTTASSGAVYLFSTLHLERAFAEFLAERAESLAANP